MSQDNDKSTRSPCSTFPTAFVFDVNTNRTIFAAVTVLTISAMAGEWRQCCVYCCSLQTGNIVLRSCIRCAMTVKLIAHEPWDCQNEFKVDFCRDCENWAYWQSSFGFDLSITALFTVEKWSLINQPNLLFQSQQWPLLLQSIIKSRSTLLQRRQSSEHGLATADCLATCIAALCHTQSTANSKHWFTTSFLQPLPYLVTP